MLRPGAVALRQFQVDIASSCVERNTLVVIPTGLGKTVIAALLIAEKMASKGGRVLFLAPSRPLADQHSKTLSSIVARGPVACLTGTEGQKKRSAKWKFYPIIAATPRVAYNDIRAGLLPRDFTVVVFDEAHSAVGDYACVPLSKELRGLRQLEAQGLVTSWGFAQADSGRRLVAVHAWRLTTPLERRRGREDPKASARASAALSRMLRGRLSRVERKNELLAADAERDRKARLSSS
jgi:hypothetical protein